MVVLREACGIDVTIIFDMKHPVNTGYRPLGPYFRGDEGDTRQVADAKEMRTFKVCGKSLDALRRLAPSMEQRARWLAAL